MQPNDPSPEQDSPEEDRADVARPTEHHHVPTVAQHNDWMYDNRRTDCVYRLRDSR